MKNPDDMTMEELTALMVEKTLIFQAIGRDDAQELQQMLDEGASLDHKDDLSGHSLLSYAFNTHAVKSLKVLQKATAKAAARPPSP